MSNVNIGVAKLATLSDGTVFEPVNSFQKNQKTLARLQRQLSRRVKFSNNWQKQKRKIQRLHSRIANIRRDYLHKVTTTVSKNHATIRRPGHISGERLVPRATSALFRQPSICQRAKFCPWAPLKRPG